MAPGSRTRVLGISSGKGGVGKSSVTVNLAVALAARGHDVGLLDADVYGFSVPKMLGLTPRPGGRRRPPRPPGGPRRPLPVDGVLRPRRAAGDLARAHAAQGARAVPRRLLLGEPDFLLIDMPPGTGDVALSLGQYLPRTEIVVVTTPQAAAQRVAQRSAYAAKKLKLAVRGVIENMSWFTGDDGTRYELFGAGGGQALADDLEVPLLGQIPLVPAVRVGGDTGVPVRVADPDGEAALAFDALATRVEELGPARIYRRELNVR